MNIAQFIGTVLTTVFVGISSIGQTIFVMPKTTPPPVPTVVENPITAEDLVSKINEKRIGEKLGQLSTNWKLSSAAEHKINSYLNDQKWELASGELDKLLKDSGYTDSEAHIAISKDFRDLQNIVDAFVNDKIIKEGVLSKTSKDIGASIKVLPTGNIVAVVIIASATNNVPAPTKNLEAYGSDPPVHCRMSAECGGGTTPLKQSECRNSVCCQVNGKWIFYKDKAQCTKDQGGNLQGQQTGATVNCVLPWGTFQLTQYWCDYYKNMPKSTTNINTPITETDPMVLCQSKGESVTIRRSVCNTLVDCQISGYYFLLTPSECSRLQKQDLHETDPANIAATQELAKQKNDQCKADAKKWYDNVYAQYGGSTGTGAYMQQASQPQYQQMISQCNNLYPL